MEGSKNPEFLKEKYGLHNESDVKVAAEYANLHAEEGDEEISSSDAPALIQNYLDRYTGILERDNPEEKDRGIRALKRMLFRESVAKQEDIPDSFFEQQQLLAREQGRGDMDITPWVRKQLAEVVIADQKSSLARWVNYLSSPNAKYPDWLKYYALRSVTGLGEYDKSKKEFTKRSKGTTKPFPDIDREALAYVLDMMEKKYSWEGVDLSKLEQTDRERFSKLLEGENFGKLYAWAVEKVTPASKESLTNTKGIWKKYDRDSDPTPLVESLQGHGTGWCTAGESTAKAQLAGGDFYVYYSVDKDEKPTVPRVAIRMEGDKIAEVRGIGPNQNLDPFIGEVVEEKMAEFPDGEKYEKRASDMGQLTSIEKKMALSQDLTRDELVFLYEIESPIIGFGEAGGDDYEDEGSDRDPRIYEIRAKRNIEADIPVIFVCRPEQIAWSINEITPDTKVFVGTMTEGFFSAIPENIERVYTRFPEGEVKLFPLRIRGKSKQDLENELAAGGFSAGPFVNEVLSKTTLSDKEMPIKLVRLKVSDLGFDSSDEVGFGSGGKYSEICARAKKLGLMLCPPEVGPELRLTMEEEPSHYWFLIAMEPVAADDGKLRLFGLSGGGEENRPKALNTPGGNWDYHWGGEQEFVFMLPRR